VRRLSLTFLFLLFVAPPYLDNSMAEIRTVTTLRSKRTEIIASIANYEKKLAQARTDLAHITAAIAIFEVSGDPEEIPPYVDIHRCFRRGETVAICKEALAQGPLNTRQLALRVMAAKGLDTGDRVLAKAIAGRLIHALRQQCRRGLIDGTEKHLGARVWALPPHK
jgi:intracellular sulfur oxidation DsrE/DsrF family protein